MFRWLQGSKDVNVLIAKGNYAKAAKGLETQLAKEPHSVHLRQLFADVLERDGQRKRAVDVLQDLADDLAAQGFMAKAMAVLKKIQRIDPSYDGIDARIATMIDDQEAGFPLPKLLADKPEPAYRPDPDSTADEHMAWQISSELLASEAWFEEAAEERDDFQWSPLFKGFSTQELAAVIGGLRLLVKKPGAIIFTEGEPGNSLFILATGYARVYLRNAVGHNDQIALLREGEFFGEAAVLTGQTREATVTAASECELLELDRDTFNRIAKTYPKVREVVEMVHSRQSAFRLESWPQPKP